MKQAYPNQKIVIKENHTAHNSSLPAPTAGKSTQPTQT